MKTLLASLLTAASLIDEAPAQAQPREEIRRSGTTWCTTEIADGTKVHCGHLVVTRGVDSLNYHFDFDDESVGITFNLFDDHSGQWHTPGTILRGIEVGLRALGDPIEMLPAAVACYRDELSKPEGIRCVAQFPSGSEFESVVFLRTSINQTPHLNHQCLQLFA